MRSIVHVVMSSASHSLESREEVLPLLQGNTHLPTPLKIAHLNKAWEIDGLLDKETTASALLVYTEVLD